MEEERGFSPAVLALSVAAAAVGEAVQCTGTQIPARSMLLWGLGQVFALMLLGALEAAALQGKELACRAVCAALLLWFGWELIQAVWQAQLLSRQQFASAAVLGLAPFLVWFGWRHAAKEFDYTARILWWLALGGALVGVLGLGGQMHWQRLLERTDAALPPAVVYAEYFAFPLLCPRQRSVQRRAVRLPIIGYLVQAGFCMGRELLFGSRQDSYTGAELLRALSVGAFSRMDSFFLLLWLMLALFRICFLCAALRMLLQRAAGKKCMGERLC